jgi:DNA processing protein
MNTMNTMLRHRYLFIAAHYLNQHFQKSLFVWDQLRALCELTTEGQANSFATYFASMNEGLRCHFQQRLQALLDFGPSMIAFLEKIEHEHRHVLTICIVDADYPDELRQISHPPLCLFGWGNRDLMLRKKVAIIGSRKARDESLKASWQLAKWQSKRGHCVVSGGALGVDIHAHQGCLEHHEASTIVVFAGGLEHLYPKRHLPIFAKIVEKGGLLLSERLYSSPCLPFHFPIRNRIIVGLSQSVYVMEAEIRSGTYSTALKALDEGREVIVYTALGSGSRQLIEDGAMHFSRVADCQDHVH